MTARHAPANVGLEALLAHEEQPAKAQAAAIAEPRKCKGKGKGRGRRKK